MTKALSEKRHVYTAWSFLNWAFYLISGDCFLYQKGISFCHKKGNPVGGNSATELMQRLCLIIHECVWPILAFFGCKKESLAITIKTSLICIRHNINIKYHMIACSKNCTALIHFWLEFWSHFKLLYKTNYPPKLIGWKF